MALGKSYMCKQWEDNDDYIVIDTDRVFGKAPCENKYEEKIKNKINGLSIIEGKIIILRTSINKCYERCIQRFEEKNPNATEEEIREYSTRKKKMYEWYNYLNDFILKVEEL